MATPANLSNPWKLLTTLANFLQPLIFWQFLRFFPQLFQLCPTFAIYASFWQYWQLLTTSYTFWHFLPASANFCQLLSTSVNFCQLLPILLPTFLSTFPTFSNFCQLLPTFINFCHFLPVCHLSSWQFYNLKFGGKVWMTSQEERPGKNSLGKKVLKKCLGKKSGGKLRAKSRWGNVR